MSLRAHFESLSDDELVSRIQSSGLTEDAMDIALNEARSRGLNVEVRESQDESVYEGDMVLLERGLSPQEAQVLTGFLRSVDIAAETGDTNTVQANSLLAIALGGASIRVPASRLQEAQELLFAFRRGDFELGDDFDTGGAAT